MKPTKPTKLGSLAARVVAQGQRLRVDETFSKMWITLRFLAERQVERESRRNGFRR